MARVEVESRYRFEIDREEMLLLQRALACFSSEGCPGYPEMEVLAVDVARVLGEAVKS